MTTPRDGTQATDDQPMPGARLVEELRLLLDALAERAEPMLNRLAAEGQDEHAPATCGWCPVCAGMAVLRGERPELAVRAAEHAVGLLTVLRSALTDPATQPTESSRRPAGPATTDAPTEQAEHPRSTRVQHIPVRRRDPGDDGEC